MNYQANFNTLHRVCLFFCLIKHGGQGVQAASAHHDWNLKVVGSSPTRAGLVILEQGFLSPVASLHLGVMTNAGVVVRVIII